jgi:general secretion pathway protein D
VQPILVPQTEVRPVGTTLLLTPNINADRSVSVRIVVEQSNVTGTATIPVALNTGAGGQGGIQEAQVDVVGSRTFSGTVVTQDNTAVAVGGLIEDAATDRDRKVPLLGDVPVLGALFRDRSRERTRRELIVILRPHVMLTPTETVRRSQEFLQGRSVHPGAAPGSPELDIYRNPSAAHAGYELQPEHRLYPGQDAAAHPPGEPAAEDPAPPAADGDEASYAELTRFAAQATVRPAATRPPAGVRPAALPSRAPVALTTDAAIEATPVASWIGRGLSVTAVRLRNRTGSERRLGPLQLRGRWLAATFQTERLGGSGTPQDATYLYLVAARPFAEALGQ